MGGKSRAGSTCSLPGGRLIRWLGVRIALCKRGLARTHMLVSMLLPLVASVEAPAYTLPAELLAKAHALERLHTVLYFGGTVWELVVLALLLRWGVGARLAKWARGLAMRRGPGFQRDFEADARWIAARESQQSVASRRTHPRGRSITAVDRSSR